LRDKIRKAEKEYEALGAESSSEESEMEEGTYLDIEESKDQLSLAIGKQGINVRLAVKLTNWKIDIIDEEEYSTRQDDIVEKNKANIPQININDILAQNDLLMT
jgi:transcription antitermination factor NusA-like protein